MIKIRVVWWLVLGFVVVIWFIFIGDFQWGCLVVKGFDIMVQCIEFLVIQYVNLMFRINCVLDVLFDVVGKFLF